ncbi:MAG TPA: hypothetical protein VI937_02380 [Negativicutes bacterium]|nr:hypothetical protein [Negativicutes bacterium]
MGILFAAGLGFMIGNLFARWRRAPEEEVIMKGYDVAMMSIGLIMMVVGHYGQ